jgi:hypothetical protein
VTQSNTILTSQIFRLHVLVAEEIFDKMAACILVLVLVLPSGENV